MTTPRILVLGDGQEPLPCWAAAFPPSHWHLMLEAEPENLAARLEERPDLLVIEMELPQAELLDLLRGLRRQAVVPILLLGSSGEDDFLLQAYEAGLDDFMRKPVHCPLLRAKLRAWLRHTWSRQADFLMPLCVGMVRLIPAERAIVIEDSSPVHLTNLEFRLLYHLLGRRNHAMTTAELCRRIWHEWEGGDAAALKNVVYRLRKKIEADPHAPQVLRTVAGVGYELAVEP